MIGRVTDLVQYANKGMLNYPANPAGPVAEPGRVRAGYRPAAMAATVTRETR
jgi:hypothetical protein